MTELTSWPLSPLLHPLNLLPRSCPRAAPKLPPSPPQISKTMFRKSKHESVATLKNSCSRHQPCQTAFPKSLLRLWEKTRSHKDFSFSASVTDIAAVEVPFSAFFLAVSWFIMHSAHEFLLRVAAHFPHTTLNPTSKNFEMAGSTDATQEEPLWGLGERKSDSAGGEEWQASCEIHGKEFKEDWEQNTSMSAALQVNTVWTAGRSWRLGWSTCAGRATVGGEHRSLFVTVTFGLLRLLNEWEERNGAEWGI